MGILSKDFSFAGRLLIAFYVVLISVNEDPDKRGAVLLLLSIYFFLSLITFVLFDRMKILNKLMEPLFLPVFVIFLKSFYSLLIFIPAIAMHINRNLYTGIFLTLEALLLTFSVNTEKDIYLYSSLLLFIAVAITSSVPDIARSLRKERKRIMKMKSLYRKLLKDFSKWELDRKELELTNFLLEASIINNTVEDFLKEVKRKLNVKSIKIIPKIKIDSFEVLKDKEKGLLSVPVKLDEGYAVIIFELESPFQLNDELVVKTLEKAGRMISLYIAGFSDSTKVGKAINIS